MDTKEVPTPNSSEKESISRREFIGLAAMGATTAVVGANVVAKEINNPSTIRALWRWITQNRDKRVAQTQAAPQPSSSIPTPQPAEMAKKEEITDEEHLSKIHSLPLDSPERKNLETDFFNKAKAVKQIDQALGALFYYKDETDNDWELRKELIDRRFKLNETDPNAPKIGNDRIEWLEREKGLHPEIVRMALFARVKAKNVLRHKLATLEGRRKFRPDLVYEESIGHLPKGYLESLPLEMLIENCLINIGGMLKLLSTETGWDYQKDAAIPKFPGEKALVSYPFTNLGKAPVIPQIDTKVFPNDPMAFRTLCAKAEAINGIKINPDLFPGSTAGAVVSQIMPQNLLDIAQMFEEAGEKFVFNDPTDAIAATWVFLAQGMEVSTENGIDYRYGYLRGNEPILDTVRIKALEKWNKHKEQVNIIYKDANDYNAAFLGNHRYAQ